MDRTPEQISNYNLLLDRIVDLEEELKEAQAPTPTHWLKDFTHTYSDFFTVGALFGLGALFVAWLTLGTPTNHFYIEHDTRIIAGAHVLYVCVNQEYSWGKDISLGCYVKLDSAAARIDAVRENWRKSQIEEQ